MIKAEIIADSISNHSKRITTFQLTYPRFIHAQLLTHRAFSRNSASSRAIPIERTISAILADTAEPISWGLNQKDMVAEKQLDDPSAAKYEWAMARAAAIGHARNLAKMGVHKQIVNRILEPFSHIITVLTGTEWDNFFNLRCFDSAQPEMQDLASKMRDTMSAHEPNRLSNREWHLPYVSHEHEALLNKYLDVSLKYSCMNRIDSLEHLLLATSVARCARVSYARQEEIHTIDEDISLHDRLLKSRHMSPFEHQAHPASDKTVRSGNFLGWIQYRQGIMI